MLSEREHNLKRVIYDSFEINGATDEEILKVCEEMIDETRKDVPR